LNLNVKTRAPGLEQTEMSGSKRATELAWAHGKNLHFPGRAELPLCPEFLAPRQRRPAGNVKILVLPRPKKILKKSLTTFIVWAILTTVIVKV